MAGLCTRNVSAGVGRDGIRVETAKGYLLAIARSVAHDRSRFASAGPMQVAAPIRRRSWIPGSYRHGTVTPVRS